MPDPSAGTRNALTPAARSSGPVRAKTMYRPACPMLVMKTLVPLRTYPSPWRRAVRFKTAAAEPDAPAVDVPVAVAAGARLQRRGVRSSCRLRERERSEQLARRKAGQPSPFLFVSAEQQKRLAARAFGGGGDRPGGGGGPGA